MIMPLPYAITVYQFLRLIQFQVERASDSRFPYISRCHSSRRHCQASLQNLVCFSRIVPLFSLCESRFRLPGSEIIIHAHLYGSWKHRSQSQKRPILATSHRVCSFHHFCKGGLWCCSLRFVDSSCWWSHICYFWNRQRILKVIIFP